MNTEDMKLCRDNIRIKVVKGTRDEKARLTLKRIFGDLKECLKAQYLMWLVAVICIPLPVGAAFLLVSLFTGDIYLLTGAAVAWVIVLPLMIYITVSKKKTADSLTEEMQSKGIIIDKDSCTEKFVIKRLSRQGRKKFFREVKEYYIRLSRYDAYKVSKADYIHTQEEDIFIIAMPAPGALCTAYRECEWSFTGLSFEKGIRNIYKNTEQML